MSNLADVKYIPGVGEGVLTKLKPFTFGVSDSTSFPSTPILVDGFLVVLVEGVDLVSPLNGTSTNLVFW